MGDYNWTTFTKQQFIRTTVEQAFSAWVTPGGIIDWFIAIAEYKDPEGKLRQPAEVVQSGDTYHWRWHQDLDMEGTVLDVKQNQIFKFTFGNPHPEIDNPIIVTVSFEQKEDTTQIRLKQDNMPDTPDSHVQWHLSCNLGWSFFLTNLKAWLEHGIDLREKEESTASASRAITQ